MARVELTIEPEPSYVRTARQVAVAVARRAGVPDETLEEVRLAVSEATGLLLRLDPERAERVQLGFVDDDPGFAVDLTAGVRLPLEPGPAAAASAIDGAAPTWSTDDDEPLPVETVLAVLDQLASTVDVASGADGVRLVLRWDPSSGDAVAPA